MSDNFSAWAKQRKLGRGGFGEVWQVETDTGLTLAAKYVQLNLLGCIDRGTLNREIGILRRLEHKNVVQFFESIMEGSCLILFTELIDGGNIASRGRLDERTATGFLRQICDGLHYLHTLSPPVLHRDIKGENIMVTSRGIVKIIDFGLSIHLLVASGMRATDAVMTTANVCGTLPFLAPELIVENGQFSVKTDVWALGITVYQMLTGGIPFVAYNKSEIFQKIVMEGAPPLRVHCSRKMESFYDCCTNRDPRERYSVRQLCSHPLFARKKCSLQ